MCELRFAKAGAGWVMGVSDGDQFCSGGDRAFDLLDIEGPLAFECQFDIAYGGADGAGCFDIGGIVGMDDDKFIAFFE